MVVSAVTDLDPTQITVKRDNIRVWWCSRSVHLVLAWDCTKLSVRFDPSLVAHCPGAESQSRRQNECS